MLFRRIRVPVGAGEGSSNAYLKGRTEYQCHREIAVLLNLFTKIKCIIIYIHLSPLTPAEKEWYVGIRIL